MFTRIRVWNQKLKVGKKILKVVPPIKPTTTKKILSKWSRAKEGANSPEEEEEVIDIIQEIKSKNMNKGKQNRRWNQCFVSVFSLFFRHYVLRSIHAFSKSCV